MRMASGLIGNEVPRKGLRVRLPCPPLFYHFGSLRKMLFLAVYCPHVPCFLGHDVHWCLWGFPLHSRQIHPLPPCTNDALVLGRASVFFTITPLFCEKKGRNEPLRSLLFALFPASLAHKRRQSGQDRTAVFARNAVTSLGHCAPTTWQ